MKTDRSAAQRSSRDAHRRIALLQGKLRLDPQLRESLHQVAQRPFPPLDFTSAISTRVSGCLNRLIVGAIFHGGQPRIVRIDDFMLEAIPEGPTLLLQNRDQPGVVGTVGAVLGEAGINISRMQLALVRERSEAAMLVNVDNAPDESVMERLRELPHMISAQLVDLGP